MKKKKSILIVSGGSIDVDFAKEYLRERQYDHIIAADSGLAHCKEIGIEPTDILGDFDSLRNLELLEYHRQKGIPLREFPTRKDYTDTHLAVKYAIDLKAEEVTILGATGTRDMIIYLPISVCWHYYVMKESMHRLLMPITK